MPERACKTCRYWHLLADIMRHLEPAICDGCYEVPEHPRWEADDA